MLEECVKDNYYARFHTQSYHCYRDLYLILDSTHVLPKSVERKIRSRAPGSKSVSRVIIMHDFILTAVLATEKCTSFLDST